MADPVQGPAAFPNFNMPQFPYPNMPAQLQASMQGPPLTNGSQYGRWNGVNNNGFGLAPSGWPSLYGYQAPQQLPWQPPWGNNGPTRGLPQLPQGQLPQLPGGQMPQLPGGGQLPQLPQGGGVRSVGLGSLPQLPKSSAPLPKIGQPMPPGMDPANFGQAPQAPTGGPNQQFNFNNSIATQSQTPTGRAYLAAHHITATSPQSASVADFNRIAQTNPVMAQQMMAAGGQDFQNAIMAANGWTKQQMNSFINQYGSGALPGFAGAPANWGA